jgi:hypothetical protein
MSALGASADAQARRIRELELQVEKLTLIVEAIPAAARALGLLPLDVTPHPPESARQARELLDQIGGYAERWLAIDACGQFADRDIRNLVALRRRDVEQRLGLHLAQPS